MFCFYLFLLVVFHRFHSGHSIFIELSRWKFHLGTRRFVPWKVCCFWLQLMFKPFTGFEGALFDALGFNLRLMPVLEDDVLLFDAEESDEVPKHSESRYYVNFFIYFFTRFWCEFFGMWKPNDSPTRQMNWLGCIATVQEGEGFGAPSGKGRGEGKKLKIPWVSLSLSDLSLSSHRVSHLLHDPSTISRFPCLKGMGVEDFCRVVGHVLWGRWKSTKLVGGPEKTALLASKSRFRLPFLHFFDAFDFRGITVSRRLFRFSSFEVIFQVSKQFTWRCKNISKMSRDVKKCVKDASLASLQRSAKICKVDGEQKIKGIRRTFVVEPLACPLQCHGDPRHLDHVCLMRDRCRDGGLEDEMAGNFSTPKKIHEYILYTMIYIYI